MATWSKFCKETGKSHVEQYKACPDCGALNLVYSSSKEPIVISDDSPQPKASFSQKQSDLSTVRFQSYSKNPQAEIVRQSSIQKARTTSQSVIKSKEELRATVTLWLRTYQVITKNNLKIEKQTDCTILGKTTIHLRDDQIESLNDFVRNTLFREITRWNELLKNMESSEEHLYLATECTAREGPVQLPNSANEIRTIKDLLSRYFPLKNRTIHVILEQEETPALYEEENVLKNPTPIKKEQLVKSEPLIKQEKETIKQESKAKRPPSASYETPQASRSRTDLNLDPLSSKALASFDFLENQDNEDGEEKSGEDKDGVDEDGEDKDGEDKEESPMALRTRKQTASRMKRKA